MGAVNPHFSVIVPAYNAANTIKRTLDAVAKQTYSNFEVIICNDGSTDETEHVLQDWIKANPLVSCTFINQSNKGVAAARNAAISKSTGQYLAFLDADDCWSTDKLQKINQLLKVNPYATWLAHHMQESGNGSALRLVKPIARAAELVLNGNTLTTSGVLLKASAFKSLGGFNEDPNIVGAEDLDLWIRLFQQRNTLTICDEVLGYYWVSKTSLTANANRHYRACMRVIEQHWSESAFIKQAASRKAFEIGRYLQKTGEHTLAQTWLKKAGTTPIALIARFTNYLRIKH